MANCNETSQRNGLTEKLTMEIQNGLHEYCDNITILDLSSRGICTVHLTVKFPLNLINLNISHNKLTEVPKAILKLDKLISLNLSFNNIIHFSDKPNFCHCIKEINLCNNSLERLPYWIWQEEPCNLKTLNLSSNTKLMQSVDKTILDKLMYYTSNIEELVIIDCSLKSCHLQLLTTMPKAKQIILGSDNSRRFEANHLTDFPTKEFKDVSSIELFTMCNTHLFNINSNIELFRSLLTINLSHNKISSLPNEFCELINLKVCILSQNHILYLPDDMQKLINLEELYVDGNLLCMFSDELPALKVLDLYDNKIYELPAAILNVQELDIAQNYIDEPVQMEYINKKEKIRLKKPSRYDGRKIETPQSESVRSTSFEEDDESSDENPQEACDVYKSSSSLEDWDSDDYWIPLQCNSNADYRNVGTNVAKPNMYSIPEQYESEGQFDDYSEDST